MTMLMQEMMANLEARLTLRIDELKRRVEELEAREPTPIPVPKPWTVKLGELSLTEENVRNLTAGFDLSNYFNRADK